MEWECVMLSWVPWRRSTSMRRARRTTVTATERCHYHPISCQQDYELRKPFFSQTIYNVSSDLGPIPTGWKQETEKDKAEVKKYKYTNTQSRENTIYRKYKVAALEATMCSTVPLEDLYKRRWSVVSATFQYIFVVSAVFQRFTAGCGGTRGWLPWPS